MELRVLLSRHGLSDAEVELESISAALELSMLQAGDQHELPADVAQRLEKAGMMYCDAIRLSPPARATRDIPDSGDRSDVRDVVAKLPAPSEAAPASMLPRLGWVAAAAAVVLAAIAWWPTSSGPENLATTAASELRSMLAAAPSDLVKASWGDWDTPEIKGVKGEVVWSDSEQRGYMKFVGLPKNDPTLERYQLWIIDSRGMEQRISGGVFDADGAFTDGKNELVVPIKPGIKVVGAAAFAVTIEKPAGTWVSDMKRRVVIAAKS
jgi:hypothetical protein